MALSTNWFRSGVRYFSSNDGSDTPPDGDGTALKPYKTIDSNLIAGDNVLRSGVYKPAPVGGILDITDKSLIGDSENVYILNTSVDLNTIDASTGTSIIDTINIQGVAEIFPNNTGNGATQIFKNSNIVGSTTVGVKAIGSDRIDGNLFKNIGRIKQVTPALDVRNIYLNNTFIDCGIQGNSSDSAEYTRCYFEGCTFQIYSENFAQNQPEQIIFKNCVFDSTCVFYEGTDVKDIFSLADGSLTGTKSPADQLVLESTNGDVNKSNFTYAYDGLTGASNPYTVTFENCFWINKANTNPFNNDAIGDYTLTSSGNGTQSILYDNGIVIGKYGLAYKVPINENTFPPSTRTNVNITGGELVLASGTSGTAESAAIGSNNEIELPFNTLLTDAIRFFGQTSGYSFPNVPSDVSNGVGKLVDEAKYDSGDEKPNVRYTFLLRYWDEDAEEVKPSPTTWYEIEHGNILGVETEGTRGNGDVDVIVGSLTPIRAKKFQIKITLRNDAN